MSVELPGLEHEDVKLEIGFSDGLLTITIPKSEQSKPRTIDVTASPS